MAKGFLSWGDVALERKGKGSSGKDEYLWLKSGNKYKVRTVHKAVHFWKYFHRDDQGRLRTAITEDPRTCPIAATHPGLAEKASERYAIYVIDRSDQQVKIMEAPRSVFSPMRQRYETNGKKPGGGADGSDWEIQVVGAGINTRYTTIYIEDTPLTKDEITKLKVELDGDKDKLKKIYAVHTPEEIEKRLFAPWSEIMKSGQSNDVTMDSNGTVDSDADTFIDTEKSNDEVDEIDLW